MRIFIKDIATEDWGDQWTASWRRHIGPRFLGCPLGRGSTPQKAIRDLIWRTEMESRVELNLVPGEEVAT